MTICSFSAKLCFRTTLPRFSLIFKVHKVAFAILEANKAHLKPTPAADEFSGHVLLDIFRKVGQTRPVKNVITIMIFILFLRLEPRATQKHPPGDPDVHLELFEAHLMSFCILFAVTLSNLTENGFRPCTKDATDTLFVLGWIFAK